MVLDIVLDVVDLAPGAAFAFLGAADVFLEAVLFLQSLGLAGLVAQGADLGLDLDELLLGGADLVIGPAVDLFGCLTEVPVVALDGLAEGGFAVAAGCLFEPLVVNRRDGRRLAGSAGASEQSRGSLGIERGTGLSVVVEVGGDEEKLLGFVGFDRQLM